MGHGLDVDVWGLGSSGKHRLKDATCMVLTHIDIYIKFLMKPQNMFCGSGSVGLGAFVGVATIAHFSVGNLLIIILCSIQ